MREKNKIDVLEWHLIENSLPRYGRFVLTKSKSGYGGCRFVYRTARRLRDYQSGDWITEGGNRLTDYGLVPIEWAYLEHD